MKRLAAIAAITLALGATCLAGCNNGDTFNRTGTPGTRSNEGPTGSTGVSARSSGTMSGGAPGTTGYNGGTNGVTSTGSGGVPASRQGTPGTGH